MAGVEVKIAGLKNLATKELHKRWRRIYHAEAPLGLSRDLLIRAVAYNVQERMQGALPQSVKRRLGILAVQLETEGGGKFKPGVMLKIGAKLVREWGGRTHTVIVLEDGFDYGGNSYRSLSMIAREITGARWSGPRFFGIRRALKPFSGAEMKAHNEQA